MLSRLGREDVPEKWLFLQVRWYHIRPDPLISFVRRVIFVMPYPDWSIWFWCHSSIYFPIIYRLTVHVNGAQAVVGTMLLRSRLSGRGLRRVRRTYVVTRRSGVAVVHSRYLDNNGDVGAGAPQKYRFPGGILSCVRSDRSGCLFKVDYIPLYILLVLKRTILCIAHQACYVLFYFVT